MTIGRYVLEVHPRLGSVPWQARVSQSQSQYEYRVLTIGGTESRNDTRRLLTDEAEYGRWELARTRMFPGGTRKVWLRRKIIHVQRTL